jgi:hypothetical protein
MPSTKTLLLVGAALLVLEGWKNVQNLSTASTLTDQVTAYGELAVGALLLVQQLT